MRALRFVLVGFGVGVVSMSCEKVDEAKQISAVQDVHNTINLDTIPLVMPLSNRITGVSEYVRSPYLKYYQHIHETSGKDCSAIAYTLAFNMVQDYVNPNNTFQCTAQHAAKIFERMKKRFQTQKPNVGQLETYFWENEYKLYGRNTAVEVKSLSTAEDLKTYILNNLEYNVILLPVAINVRNFAQGVRGDLTLGKPEEQYYITNTVPNSQYPYYGHFILVLARYKSNGRDVVGYLDCLAPNGKNIEMRYCTLDRLCQSNQATSSYSPKKYAVLRMQHR